jgi:hypothetical protein
MSDLEDEDAPGWKRLLANENLWVATSTSVILLLAFWLATRS